MHLVVPITIKFIGLLVTTTVPAIPTNNPTQVVVVMGNFNLPMHKQLIAWPKGSRVKLPPSEEWPTNPTDHFKAKDGTEYEYANVTIENVTLSGPTEPLSYVMDKAIPHLTCCCQQFLSGLNPPWGDKNYSVNAKRSAFFTFTSGTYTIVEEPPPPGGKTGPVSTAIGFTQNTTLTFQGQIGNSVRKIKLQPPQSSLLPYILFVADTPLEVLEGKPMPNPGEDFKSYYNMGAGTQGCTALPGNPKPNPCAPADAACPRVMSPLVPNNAMKIAQQIRANLKRLPMMVDMNCSSSAWP
jgi:hypothetical protein